MRLDHLLSMETMVVNNTYSILRVRRFYINGVFPWGTCPDCGWIPERPKGADCKSVALASKVRILLRPPIYLKIMLDFLSALCYI